MSNLGLIINEKQCMRCIIDDPDRVIQVDRNYFISPVGRALFDASQELFTKNVPITREHLTAEGNRRCDDVTPVIVDALFDDIDFSPDAFKTHYLPRLKSDYAKKMLEDDVLKAAVEESMSKDALNVDNVRNIMLRMQEMLDLYEGKESRLLSLDQAGRAYEQRLRERSTAMKYRVSDSHLNRALVAGLVPKHMTVVFGATGVGKSALALHMGNKDINKHNPAAYISLEMDLVSTFDRLAGMRQGIPLRSLMPNPETGLVESFVLEAISAEIARLRRNESFFFAEEDSLMISDVESLIKEAKRRARVDYLVVYLDLMTMIKEFSGNEASDYERGMNLMHEMCRRQGVHIINVVQANRKADDAQITSIEQLERLRPRRNTIKNSQAILERCRNQLAVFRPRYYAEQLFPNDPALADMPDTFEVQTLKQSMGPVGAITKYLYRGEVFQLIPIREPPRERAA